MIPRHGPGRRQAHRRGPCALHKSHLISVSSEIDEEENLLGLTVADLQSGVTVTGNAVSGTLLAVTGYTGFSGDPAEQSGHYLALVCTAQEGDTITAELIGGLHGPVTLDDDGILIVRVTDKDAQKLKYTATAADGSSESRLLDLSGLTLA